MAVNISRHLGFQRVVFDCDSTLVTVEGIDELARLKGLSEQIAELTRQAMDGLIPLEQVYAKRLDMLQPTRAELVRVGRVYRRTLVPQAAEVVAALQEAGLDVAIVSGGLKAAVLDLAASLKVPAANVHAVAVEMDELQGEWWNYLRYRYSGNPDERYLAFAPTPLAESDGKVAVLKSLGSDKRTMMIGDGSTDLATRDVVRLFVGFGGVERRQAVADAADVFVEGPGLAAILPLALSHEQAEKLYDTPYEEVYRTGIDLLKNGGVQFKQELMRERVIQAHTNRPQDDDLLQATVI
jgi:phosphoserine phosphatase